MVYLTPLFRKGPDPIITMKARLLFTLLALAASLCPALAAEPASAPAPISVTAVDLITKVFGALAPSLSHEQACEEAANKLALVPELDETGLWLNPDSGYSVSYYGMTPEVYAVANFNENGASEYGYFFLFPYSGSDREWANSQQCVFCSSLLQEIYDLGLMVGIPDTTDSIFEAFGSYGTSQIAVSLNEQNAHNLVPEASPEDGVFVVALSITPNAFPAAAGLMAEAAARP